MLKNTIRRRAQKAAPNPTCCQDCGATGPLERHHQNYQEPDRFEVLCQPCHVKADQRDGTRRRKQPIPCKVCGVQFLPSHSKKHTTCSRQCLAEIGRRNAQKRWGTGTKNQPTPRE
jgi:hypothetical protein